LRLVGQALEWEYGRSDDRSGCEKLQSIARKALSGLRH